MLIFLETLKFIVMRNDQQITLSIKPNLVDGTDAFGNNVKKKNDRY